MSESSAFSSASSWIRLGSFLFSKHVIGLFLVSQVIETHTLTSYLWMMYAFSELRLSEWTNRCFDEAIRECHGVWLAHPCEPELQHGVLNRRQTAVLLCAVFTDSPIWDHTTCYEGTAASYHPVAQQQQPASSGPDMFEVIELYHSKTSWDLGEKWAEGQGY